MTSSSKTYPLFKVHVDVEASLKNIRKVLESGFINEGEAVTELTAALSDFLEAPHLIAVNSGTSALTLALKLSGVGVGDEVISTAMTCVATNTPIANLGAQPVWADIDASTGMIDPAAVERAFTPRTKAVMAVLWSGMPCELDRLSELCKKRGVALIQDAAHGIGARYRGRPIHEFSDFTCYSLQAIKHMTTGDGGALVSRDQKDFQRSKKLKWFGIDRETSKDAKGNWRGQSWDVDIEEAGYKFNMNNLAAAVGLAQLPHLPFILSRHRENAEAYRSSFLDSHYLNSQRVPDGAESSYWVYTVVLKDDVKRVARDRLLEALNAEGILAGVVHVPNDDYTCFRSSRVSLPGVRKFSDRQISLPCGWWLSRDEVRHIASRIDWHCRNLLNAT